MGMVGTGLACGAGAGRQRGLLLLRRDDALARQPGEQAGAQARGFYTVIAIATLAGTAMNFVHINPIKALFWTAVINGVIAVPMLAAA